MTTTGFLATNQNFPWLVCVPGEPFLSWPESLLTSVWATLSRCSSLLGRSCRFALGHNQLQRQPVFAVPLHNFHSQFNSWPYYFSLIYCGNIDSPSQVPRPPSPIPPLKVFFFFLLSVGTLPSSSGWNSPRGDPPRTPSSRGSGSEKRECPARVASLNVM